jgi:osmotically-inducible protein OsmY
MKKTDYMVFESVMDELNWDSDVCAVDIVVTVTNGLVKLDGTVQTEAEKLMAETMAAMVDGVRSVHSSLRVVDGVADGRTDNPILRRVYSALHGLGFIDTSAIQVKVEDGWVRLSGLVDSEEQRRYLVWLIQKLLGIREVTEAFTLRSLAPVFKDQYC